MINLIWHVRRVRKLVNLMIVSCHVPLVAEGSGTPARCRGGFTLTELLVVVSILVLMLTVGAGVWQSLAGNASVEAAFNQISTVVGRVREEARAIRTPRGSFLFKDESNRIAVVQVYHNDPGGRPGQIEVIPGTEALLLKPGVAVAFSKAPQPGFALEGLLLFDGDGQIYVRDFVVRADGELGRKLNLSSDLAGNSGLGLRVMRSGDLEAQPVIERDAWISEKGLQIVLSRYNGITMESVK